MFHTSYFNAPNFQEWLAATNNLGLKRHLELKGKKKDYTPLRIDEDLKEQYLLYIDDEAGICGTAVISPCLFQGRHHQKAEKTWILRNVLFHIRVGHLLHECPDRFSRVAKQFHLGLFEHLWKISQTSSTKTVLSIQTDWEVHEDLQFFGGFTFQKKDFEEHFEEDDQSVAIGIMSLNRQAWSAYQKKKSACLDQIEGSIPLIASELNKTHQQVSL